MHAFSTNAIHLTGALICMLDSITSAGGLLHAGSTVESPREVLENVDAKAAPGQF